MSNGQWNTHRRGIQLGIFLAALVTLIYTFGNEGLIGFFKLNHESVSNDARIYLIIVGAGMIFTFMNQIFLDFLQLWGIVS